MPRPHVVVRRLLVAQLMVLLVGLTGCADIREVGDDVAGTATQLPDRVRFCLSVARAVNAVESGAPETATDAIEEAVAQAPDDRLDAVRDLAERIRAAEGAGADALRDPALVEEARQLRVRVRDRCQPA